MNPPPPPPPLSLSLSPHVSRECCNAEVTVLVCVYYCSTYYKAVRMGGIVEDMCYVRRRAGERLRHVGCYSAKCVSLGEDRSVVMRSPCAGVDVDRYG